MLKNKLNILSTRPLPKAIIKKAEEQNIFIDCISFIETQPITSPELKEQIQELGQKKITAVFTSMNAVEAIKEYLPAKPDWIVFSIGETTKSLIKDSFRKEKLIATANDAARLADAIIAKGVKEIVFFCGEQRREELPLKLKAAGIEVEEIIVYRTVQTSEKISKRYDGILFFSPSAVQSFFSKNKLDKDVVAFAIGNTTADAIKEHVDNQVVIADKPGKEALVKKMMAYKNPGGF